MVATSDLIRKLTQPAKENEWMYVLNGVRDNRKRTRKAKENIDIAKAN